MARSKKKPLTFFAMIADVFKARLAEAGYKTIVRAGGQGDEFGANRMDIHIQGMRKRHVLTVHKQQSRRDNHLPSYHITLESARLRSTYIIWASDGPVRLEDPNFNIDVDSLADQVIEFMDHIKAVNTHLIAAHGVFDTKYGSFDPDRKRVSWAGV